MSIYKKQEIIASYPAYDVVEREAASNGSIQIQSNETMINGLRIYTVDTAANDALENGEDPAEAYNECIESGEEAFWLLPDAITLTAHDQARETHIKVDFDATYHLEGKFFKIEKARNNNLKFVEVVA